MDIKIKVFENKTCNLSDLILGNESEKGVDKIVLDIDSRIPQLNWYLVFDTSIYAFNNKNEIIVTDDFTSQPGAHSAYIVGSNAKAGKPINSGDKFFNSNKIIMRVRERG